jgi:hypothetical protein
MDKDVNADLPVATPVGGSSTMCGKELMKYLEESQPSSLNKLEPGDMIQPNRITIKRMPRKT